MEKSENISFFSIFIILIVFELVRAKFSTLYENYLKT